MKAKLFFLCLFLIISILKAQIITTVAGNGIAGFSGDGGQATNAQLNSPWGITFDATGNMYIADYLNNRIRKVSTSGIITTIAGNGIVGFGGDGGPAIAAELYTPTKVAVDAANNVCIEDEDNMRVRKINSSGIITTIAGNGSGGFSGDGGQAINAELLRPVQIAFDVAGNLYISDTQNNRIRKVTTTGIITTIAGTATQGYNSDGGQATNAELYFPYQVTFDATGNIYIADGFNNRIRKINTAGIISTVAGNGIAGFSGDCGQATNAQLNLPHALTSDAAGNLYIGDSGNNRVRMVNTSGIITTIAGNGAAAFSGDGGPANAAALHSVTDLVFGATGNLYLVDNYNNRVRMITAPLFINSPVTITGNTNICPGGSTILTAGGASSYTWSANAGGTNTGTVSVAPISNTTYTLFSSGGGTCSNYNNTITVNVAALAVAISGDTILCNGDSTILTAHGANSYTWSTGDTTANILLNPELTTTYTVTGITGTCSNDATTTVNVSPAFAFVMPNIVTPNNDGINDFIDFSKFQFSLLQLEIYNRWGIKVFESTNPACIWKPNGDDGTYFYTVHYTSGCNNKQNKALKGFITVLR